MIRLFLWTLLTAPLFAQLQVSLYDGTTEHPLSAVTNLGSATMGDATEFRFHARNLSATAGFTLTLAVAGNGFTISDRPAPQTIIAPQNFVEFRLAFAPTKSGSYSATLTVNSASYLLTAASAPAPTLTLPSNPALLLPGGANLSFGAVQRNHPAVMLLQLSNATQTPLTVQSITVRGDAFQGPTGIVLPAALAAGAAVTFQIIFTPKTDGPLTGVLAIDNRSFNLTGTGFDAPLPQPRITITGSTTSASQPKLSIAFDSAPESSGTGTLTLDFQPSTAIATDDPGVLFPVTGSRRLSFQVNEGDATASFGTAKEAIFQTGTTAGVITFTVQLASYTIRSTVTIAPALIVVDTSTTARRVSDLDITITGFDNTRTAGKFNFTFYDRTGAQVSPGVVHADSTADFGRYFAITRVGSAFLMRATFPVTGDATQLGSVDVELINSAGSTRTARLNLQ